MSGDWVARMPYQRVTDPEECEEMWDLLTQDPAGIDGYVYRDGEVWCDQVQLGYWRATHWPEAA